MTPTSKESILGTDRSSVAAARQWLWGRDGLSGKTQEDAAHHPGNRPYGEGEQRTASKLPSQSPGP